jgi:hypothetical protein
MTTNNPSPLSFVHVRRALVQGEASSLGDGALASPYLSKDTHTVKASNIGLHVIFGLLSKRVVQKNS